LTKLLPSASALFNCARNERASAFGPAGLGRRVIGDDADFTCFAYAPAVLARRQLKPFFYLSAEDKIQIRASEAKGSAAWLLGVFGRKLKTFL